MGGGIAGLTAAVELTARGHEVTLLEAKGQLGGRASDGVHFLWGHFTETIDLLKRLETNDQLQQQRSLRLGFILSNGRPSFFQVPRRAIPFPFTTAVLRFGGLGLRDKFRILALGYRLRRHLDNADLDQMTASQWLTGQGQPESLQKFWWNRLCQLMLYVPLEVCSARSFVFMLRTLLVSGGRTGLVFPQVDLSALMLKPAEEFIRSRGGHILFNTPVSRLHFHGWEFKEIELEGGRRLEADILLLAPPVPVLRRLLPESILYQDAFFGALRHLQLTPVLNLHLWFDRDITDEDLILFESDSMQHLVNRGKYSAVPGYVVLVWHGARAEMALPGPQLITRSVQELQKLLPAAAVARLKHASVVKDVDALLSSRVGVNRFRLPQKSPYHNLYLAGDWTDTGFFPSIESAVRSGKKAVELILNVK